MHSAFTALLLKSSETYHPLIYLVALDMSEMNSAHLQIFEKTASEDRTRQMCIALKEVIQPLSLSDCIQHLLCSLKVLDTMVMPLCTQNYGYPVVFGDVYQHI